MAIIDDVKCDTDAFRNNQVYAWRFPSQELSTWTQLIVNESQEAALVRGGVMEGPFGPGRHTLSTENIPLVSKLINLPFGRSPFTAEVWFVNRAMPLDGEAGRSGGALRPRYPQPLLPGPDPDPGHGLPTTTTTWRPCAASSPGSDPPPPPSRHKTTHP